MADHKRETMRDLTANELDRIGGGGNGFHPRNPVLPVPPIPEPPIPPITIFHPGGKGIGGPVFPPFPGPGPFPIG